MSNYIIEGAKHKIHINQPCMLNNDYYPNFQKELAEFKSLIFQLISEKRSVTFIHFGDGDYYFLNCMPVGSATPGKRALSKPYSQIDMKPYTEGFLKNDYICVEIFEQSNIDKFKQMFGVKKTIPTEFLYGLTANKWFTSTFNGHIGLIGAAEKLDLIQELLKRPEYKQYLQIDNFNDYIKLPQKFACDDLNNTIEIAKKQLLNAKSKIFLCGMGHVKSGLLHEMKKIYNAVYVDVGSGIDALAGVIDPERPYMFDWVNYKIKNTTNNNIDLLQFDQTSNVKIID